MREKIPGCGNLRPGRARVRRREPVGAQVLYRLPDNLKVANDGILSLAVTKELFSPRAYVFLDPSDAVEDVTDVDRTVFGHKGAASARIRSFR
jgi:hypothetical protein